MNTIRIHGSITKTTLSFLRHMIHIANTKINSLPLVFWVKFYISETFLPSFTIKSEAQGKIITDSLPHQETMKTAPLTKIHSSAIQVSTYQ
jgi:hypothetical protein